jgi:hypothetical protein
MSTYAERPGAAQVSPEPRPRGRSGRLTVHLRGPEGAPFREPAVVLALEHRAALAEQHRLETGGKETVSLELPEGHYSLQAIAADHAVARGLAQVRAGRSAEVSLTLLPQKAETPSLIERLKVYGIEVRADEIQPLHVPPHEKLVLDSDRYRDTRAFRILKPRSINDLKRWIGAPDGAFGHDQPRFGPAPRVDVERLKGEPTQEVATALRAIAREYIHGNARAVAQYEPTLTRYLLSREAIAISIFFFNVVTINAGATLEIGRGSNVFACDELRIHRDGTLLVVGEVRADIGRYVVFG